MKFPFGPDQPGEKAEGTYYAKCLGGTTILEKPRSGLVFFYPDRIYIEQIRTTIPYSSMTNVETTDERKAVDWEKMSWGVVALPLVAWGFVKKMKRGGTIIRYLDAGISKFVILDFGVNFQYAHPLIHERMTKFQQVIKSDKATILISIQVSSPQIGTGKTQKSLLKTQDDKSNEILENVKINGEILYPSGGIARFEEDITDKNGELSYSWNIPANSEEGTYTARFSGAIEGYRVSSASVNFEISKDKGGAPFI